MSIYVVRRDGSREPFVVGLPNPTSMALDPRGRLHVSSRFDGSVHLVASDGSVSTVATDLGVACGIAFDRDGDSVRGRSIRIRPPGSRWGRSRSSPAFLRAWPRSTWRSVPTAGCMSPPRRCRRETWCIACRPRGPSKPFVMAWVGRRAWRSTAMDTCTSSTPSPDRAPCTASAATGQASRTACCRAALCWAWPSTPLGGLVVSSSETVYRLDVGLKGVLPIQPAPSPVSA